MFGKWPHEVLLCRNDADGEHFDMSLGIFDIQCATFYNEELAKANKGQVSSGKEY